MNSNCNQDPNSVNQLASELCTDSSSRHNTLKDRIKRRNMEATQTSMTSGNDPSSPLPTQPCRRRASVLDAASALASMHGVPSNSYPFNLYAGMGIGAYASNEMDVRRGRNMMPPSLHSSATAAARQETLAVPFGSLRGEVPMTFPEKLMEVLSNEEISDVISWLPHGKGFAILQKRKFATEVMPLYFKQSKFASFTRKLNRWGFTRVPNGPEMGAYYHKLFQRGNNLLCMQMHCQSTGSSKASVPDKGTKSPPTRSPRSSPTPSQQSGDSKADGDNNIMSIDSPRAQVSRDIMPSFDEVLQRQRQILREAQQDEKNNSAFAGQGPNLDEVLGLQQELLRSSSNGSYGNSLCMPCAPQLMQQEELRLESSQESRFDGVDPALQAQRMFLQGSVSPRRHHRLIEIESAMDALENERQFRPGHSSISTEDYEAATSSQMLQARSQPAIQMQSRLRQLESHNQPLLQDNEDVPIQGSSSANSSPMLRAKLHSAMQARLRQLEERNRSVGDALKSNDQIPSLSSFDVARFRNQMGQGRQANVRESKSKSSWRSVRRASAA